MEESMELQTSGFEISDLKNKLSLDCSKCMGLCCTALFFSKIDGFPDDKGPGEKCEYMDKSYRCKEHEKLEDRGYTGCMSFDCLGAGPMVVSLLKDQDASKKELAKLYEAFIMARQVYEVIWYLVDAFEKSDNDQLKKKISELTEHVYTQVTSDHDTIRKIYINEVRDKAKPLLSEVSDEYRMNKTKSKPERFETDIFGRIDLLGKSMKNSNIMGMSLKGAIMIQSDFSNTDFSYVDLIGADMRDAKLHNADLSKAIYLTQMQINSALGNRSTKLPRHISMPARWK